MSWILISKKSETITDIEQIYFLKTLQTKINNIVLSGEYHEFLLFTKHGDNRKLVRHWKNKSIDTNYLSLEDLI